MWGVNVQNISNVLKKKQSSFHETAQLMKSMNKEKKKSKGRWRMAEQKERRQIIYMEKKDKFF